MRLRAIRFFFLTGIGLMVLFQVDHAIAAPQTEMRKSEESPPTSEKAFPKESLQITGGTEDVDPIDETVLYRTRKYGRKAVVGSIGLWSGAFSDGEYSSSISGSLHQVLYDSEETAWDWGVELLQIGHMGINGGRRLILSPYKNYEPFVRFGIGSIWKASEALAGVVNIYRYQFRLGAGFEDLFGFGRKFRAELDLAWGLPEIS